MKENIEKDLALQNKIMLYNMVTKDCLKDGLRIGHGQKNGVIQHDKCLSSGNKTGTCNVGDCPIVQIKGKERREYLENHHVG